MQFFFYSSLLACHVSFGFPFSHSINHTSPPHRFTTVHSLTAAYVHEERYKSPVPSHPFWRQSLIGQSDSPVLLDTSVCPSLGFFGGNLNPNETTKSYSFSHTQPFFFTSDFYKLLYWLSCSTRFHLSMSIWRQSWSFYCVAVRDLPWQLG